MNEHQTYHIAELSGSLEQLSRQDWIDLQQGLVLFLCGKQWEPTDNGDSLYMYTTPPNCTTCILIAFSKGVTW